MEIFDNIIPDFSYIFHIAYLVVITYYGWVVFMVGLIYMLWRLYYVEIEHQYIAAQDWIFLQLKVPQQNMISTVAVETIFSQMHALHVGKTFYEKYVEGQIQLWYSLEIISMGGKISFIMRIPARMKDTVESAFYAHYPQAEISEVGDYMESFHYDPYKPEGYDIFGSEWHLTEDDVIPIKSYKDFEHPAAEETIVDPLANMFEGLAHINPDEFIGYQILIQPLSDEEWKPRGELKVKELIGEEVPHGFSLIKFLLTPLEKFAGLGRSHQHAHVVEHDPEGKRQRNKWLGMTEGEKERVTLIEKKIGKQGYKTQIRMLYIVPAEKFDNSKKGLMSGFYRPFGSVMTNKLKPDVNDTWTSADAYFSKTFEKPVLDYMVKYRKRNLFNGYKRRDFLTGLYKFILGTDEIATLYHFPITTETTFAPTAVEKTQSKKSQPPVNLPIAEMT